VCKSKSKRFSLWLYTGVPLHVYTFYTTASVK
jgi:hypothetical protein